MPNAELGVINSKNEKSAYCVPGFMSTFSPTHQRSWTVIFSYELNTSMYLNKTWGVGTIEAGSEGSFFIGNFVERAREKYSVMCQRFS